MMRHQVLAIIVLAWIYTPFLYAAPRPVKDPRCFNMTPITNFDDKSCNAVKVRIQFKDCTLGSSINNPVEVYAHFECHSKPPRLKYWFKNTMLFADLSQSDDSYRVTKTYGFKYGNNDEDKEVDLNPPTVLPPASNSNVLGAVAAAGGAAAGAAAEGAGSA